MNTQAIEFNDDVEQSEVEALPEYNPIIVGQLKSVLLWNKLSEFDLDLLRFYTKYPKGEGVPEEEKNSKEYQAWTAVHEKKRGGIMSALLINRVGINTLVSAYDLTPKLVKVIEKIPTIAVKKSKDKGKSLEICIYSPSMPVGRKQNEVVQSSGNKAYHGMAVSDACGDAIDVFTDSIRQLPAINVIHENHFLQEYHNLEGVSVGTRHNAFFVGYTDIIIERDGVLYFMLHRNRKS